MARYAKILISIVLILALIVAVMVLVASTFNWNYARPWANQQLSALTHRSVEIQGDLTVDWQRPVARSGWQNWIPWPEITAYDIHVGQPDWTRSDQEMGRAAQLTLLIDPVPLLSNTIRVEGLGLRDADVDLIRTESGASNWTLTEQAAEPDREASWQFVVLQLYVEDVKVRARDASLSLDVLATLDSLDNTDAQSYGIEWQAQGQYNEGTIEGNGRAGGLLSLQDADPEAVKPFPIQARMSIGETVIQFEGSVTRPTQFAALDVGLELKGKTMADLNPLFDVVLPNTPPYQTKGQLTYENGVWHYADFTGTVGSSDLRGTLEFHDREARPFLTGTVQSDLLNFEDLGPLIGVDPRDEQETLSKQPSGKALPADPINTENWDAMDADVHFRGKKIVRSENLPLDDVEAHIKLDNKLLSLTPLRFGVAGGQLDSEIHLDGRQEQIDAQLTASARQLRLRELLKVAESMRASLGTMHAEASLSGRGRSFAELLGNANGEIKAVVSKGTVSHFLLEAAGLNIADMVIVKLFGDEQVVLNCLAADFGVKDGLMHTKAFKLDTEDATIDITGNINLATEELDLDIDPENKSLRIFTLRTPLYVRGTFKDPDVGVHEGPIAARAGAAVALGVIATPLAALLPLLNIGTDDSNECAPLLKAATQKTDTPPPADAP